MRTPSKSPTGKTSGRRPVTAAYLRNAAMHYISGRAASVAMVRQTLERRAMRRLEVARLDDKTRHLIEATITNLVSLGLIDDARFAEARAATLARKGLPRRRIAQGLRGKGIAEDTIETSIDGEVDDFAQAIRFVERKRLGRYRRGGMTTESRTKDLAALARAGFAFAVSVRALDQPEDK